MAQLNNVPAFIFPYKDSKCMFCGKEVTYGAYWSGFNDICVGNCCKRRLIDMYKDIIMETDCGRTDIIYKINDIFGGEFMLMFEIEEKEMVDHPSHYNQGIETIEYIESWSMNFNTGNVIKYVTRAGYKNNQLEDMKKAMWYLQREIDRLENKGE